MHLEVGASFKFIYLSIFLLIYNFAVFAQTPGINFHQLTVQNGLSENTVRDIIEDEDGFMWFTTEDGVNKFDGYDFTVYKKDPANKYSISSSSARFFYKDKTNRLWILTRGGLNIFDPYLNRFYNFQNEKYKALQFLSEDIEGMSEDINGTFWILTHDSGMHKISSLTETPERIRYEVDLEKKFSSILILSDTCFWIGTTDGLISYNPKKNKFKDLAGLYGKGYEIKKIYKDTQGNIWFCTLQGLKVVKKNGEFKEYMHSSKDIGSIAGNYVSGITPYNNENFLISIDGGGIDYFDVKEEKFYHLNEKLPTNNITCLYLDRKKDLWAGSFLTGILYSNSTTNLFVFEKNIPYSPKNIKKGIITRFLKDSKGNLWITTDGGGIYKRSPGSENYIHYQEGEKGLTNNAAIAIVEDEDGYVWVSTYGGGLFKYNPKTDRFTSYTRKNSSISNHLVRDLRSYNGKIWASTFGSGLTILDKSTNQFNNYISDDWAQTFFVSKDNTLWIGSLDGISKYNPDTDSFDNYKFKSKTTTHGGPYHVADIVEDEYGNLWIGTRGKGLIQFNPKDESFKVYTTENGLSDNFIVSIVIDDRSNLWISTNNGITYFESKLKKARPYTFLDGAPPCTYYLCSKYKDEEGKIYFGANNGYVVIDPNMTQQNNVTPPVAITEFRVFNEIIFPGEKDSPLREDISKTKEIILSHNQNSFTFKFASLNFNNSQNNQYAYYLEGFENNWVMCGQQRSATYTNLNPGTYIFKVMGSNNDNLWNQEGKQIKIIIEPPFWKTKWFISLCFLSSLILIGVIHFGRIRAIKSRNIELERVVKERTNELKETNEQLETFVYKASHDIKGPLKSIISLLALAQTEVKDEVANGFLEQVLKSTKKLEVLLLDLLQLTKVKQASINQEPIEFSNMITEALCSFENFEGYERIKFNIDIQSNALFYSDKKLLYSVIQNLVENPIKYADFSKSENYLNIKINVTSKEADLIFEDNGIGIPSEVQDKIFDMFYKVNERSNGTGLGLYIVKSTVEKLNGTIEVESEVGKGSKFILCLKNINT